MESDIARLFIGFAIPEHVKTVLKKTIKTHYHEHIQQLVPHERWHITVVFLGNVDSPQNFYHELSKPLIQTHVPVVKMTHVGPGLPNHQLWAYANATPALQQIKTDIRQRLASVGLALSAQEEERPYVPHIRLADLTESTSGPFRLSDTPSSVSFPVKEAHIYRSHQSEGGVRYTIEASITLAP